MSSSDNRISNDVVSWREYDIHDEESNDEDEQQAFQIFDQPSSEDLESFDFPLYNNNAIISLTCQEDYTQSTGMAVWKGSEVLCDFIQQQQRDNELFHYDTQQILELGAGVGLCSITAYCLSFARNVLATDGDSKVLEILRKNIERNRKSNHVSTISCHQLIWGRNLQEFVKEHGKSDVVLASDVFYMSKSLKPLFETVQALMKEDGLFLVASLCSIQAPMETVLSVATSFEFSYSCPPDTEDIYLFRRIKEKEHQGS